ncbi:uncharacterized protein LOC113763025 [Coffea eugenioides]|uniref:uncharacterized protein LOC113763025 n=1 Tax=Coffea eugenioides TaxID=49369 RepID=UPI000F610136|nr:uncharacterized protein LOC113763025 [Coffea eugenioides]
MESSSYKEGRDAAEYKRRFPRRVLGTWISCLASFSVSMLGGLMLTHWELRHHRTNSQLWMVPFGLILLVTPAIVWLSIFISHIFSSNEGEEDHKDGGDLHPAVDTTVVIS